MHIESLQLFYKIAIEKSISKVATSSHISQPALSQQMHKLEESVDAKLFERSNKGIELTSAGKIMESYSLQFSQIYDNLIEDLNTLKKCNSVVRIYSDTEVGIYGLPCTLKKIKKNLPTYNFNLSLMPSIEVENKIKQKQADIGFIIGDTTDNTLISKTFRMDKIVLVASKNFNINDKISLKEVLDIPLLALSEDFSSRYLFNKYIQEKNISSEDLFISHTLNSVESTKTILMDGNQIAFLPYLSVRKEINSNQLKLIEVENFNLDYEINMIFNQDITNNTEHIISHFLKYTKCMTCVA